MDLEDKKKLINNVGYWRHRIDLGEGLISPGVTRLNAFDRHGLGRDEIQGKSYLDIGAWDGYYSFKAEELGAKDVLATDVWRDMSNNRQRWESIRSEDEGIFTAKKVLNSKVRIKNLDVYNLVKGNIGRFDIVNFTGVIYHLKNPNLALEVISEVCKEVMVFETTCVKLKDDPAGVFEKYPFANFRNGGAGWFFNKVCLYEMIKNAGFKEIIEKPMKVNSTENEVKTGILKKDVKIRKSFETDDFFEINLSENQEVIICGTENCNMDLESGLSKWVRIQLGQLGAVQGWVKRSEVEVVPRKTIFPGSNNDLEFYRLALLAYK